MLETLNYKVLAAANGKEALQVYDTHADAISLILTDLVMPQMGSGELIAALYKKNPDLHFVLMSGYAPDATRAENFIKKADGILEKPLTLERVANAINRAFEKKA